MARARDPRRRLGGPAVALVVTLALTGALLAAPTTAAGAPERGPTGSGVTGGTVVAWGHGGQGQTDVPEGLDDVVDVAAGHEHGVALRADGTVVAWGHDSAGQATVPEGLDDVVDVDAGAYFSLALRADGTVVGWGDDLNGASVPPADLTDVVAVSGGSTSALALRADGTVVGWGDDTDGRATPPPGLDEVVAIAAGGTHALALRADGTVVAWGWDGYGQTDVPEGLDDVVAIGAGTAHSLAVRADGTLVAWGGSFSGQADVPADLTDVVAADGGVHFTVALRGDGTVAAWGEEGDATAVPEGLTGVTQVAAGGRHVLALVGGPDTGPPVIEVPDDVVRTAVSAKGVRVTWPAVTARDAAGGPLRAVCDPPSGTRFAPGATTVTCTATDAAGRSASASFTVTVVYEWSGWKPPIEPELGFVLQAGRLVPVRFALTGPSRFAQAEATLWYAPVGADGVVGPLEPAARHERGKGHGRSDDGTPSNAFHRDAWTGRFTFLWSTAGLAPGAYELVIDLGDDQPRTARITLR